MFLLIDTFLDAFPICRNPLLKTDSIGLVILQTYPSGVFRILKLGGCTGANYSLPPLLPSPPFLSSPPFPSPSSPSHPFPSPSLSSRPHIAARGLGERSSSPSGSGRSPAAKRYLVHFRLKNASGKSNFKYIFTKIHQQI